MNKCRENHGRRKSTPLIVLVTTAAVGAATALCATVAHAVTPPAGAVRPTAVPPGAAPADSTPPGPPVEPAVGSYDVGLLLGGQIEHNGLGPKISYDDMMRGIKDALGGRAIRPDEREIATRFMHDARDSLSGKNRAQGREFLERNAGQPGVVTLPSGLQYKILAAGDPKGKPPAPTDDVTVRYVTRLVDGKEIDNSESHGRPATFRVNSVFKAWQEAFAKMKPGAKWELFVPPELGYGNNPPPSIPPGSLLIYDLELLRIEPPTPMDPSARAPAGAIKVPAKPKP